MVIGFENYQTFDYFSFNSSKFIDSSLSLLELEPEIMGVITEVYWSILAHIVTVKEEIPLKVLEGSSILSIVLLFSNFMAESAFPSLSSASLMSYPKAVLSLF